MARKSRKQNATMSEQVVKCSNSYSVALYARISVENEKKRESDSIGNQIQMLRDFVSEDPDMTVFDIYCDDDISGTDFVRPEFARMMNDIRDGKVNCIVVKDLSRLGRNGIETGEYIEMVFPFMQVRFIAITDRFDTKTSQADIGIQLKNLINERYARDISGKICSAMRTMQKQGKFVGGRAPYGYLRDPNDKHRLIPDPEAAPVVHELFEMIANGHTLHYAAVTMNGKGIPSPGRHNYDLGLVKSDKFKNSLWYQQTVRRILLDKTYLGWLIGGKSRSDFQISGEKGSKPVPEDDWIITKGAHEPIVEESLFYKVQEYFTETQKARGFAAKYQCKSRQASIFKGHLRCGECGKAMFLRAKKNHGKKTWWYYCTLHENYNASYCPKKSVKKEDLEATVLRLIQTQMKLFTDAQELIRTLNKRSISKRRFKIYQEQIQETKKKIENYSKMKADLYSDYAIGDLSKTEYLQRIGVYAEKADNLQIFLKELEKEAEKYAPEYRGSEKWLQMIEKYSDRNELDEDMIDAFIEEIILFNDGHYEVTFAFHDEMEAVLLQASMRKKEAERYAR